MSLLGSWKDYFFGSSSSTSSSSSSSTASGSNNRLRYAQEEASRRQREYVQRRESQEALRNQQIEQVEVEDGSWIHVQLNDPVELLRNDNPLAVAAPWREPESPTASMRSRSTSNQESIDDVRNELRFANRHRNLERSRYVASRDIMPNFGGAIDSPRNELTYGVRTRTDRLRNMALRDEEIIVEPRNEQKNEEIEAKFERVEESWYVTPPAVFTERSPQEVEVSPLENLLIEHPSMSVYSFNSTSDDDESRPSASLVMPCGSHSLSTSNRSLAASNRSLLSSNRYVTSSDRLDATSDQSMVANKHSLAGSNRSLASSSRAMSSTSHPEVPTSQSIASSNRGVASSSHSVASSSHSVASSSRSVASSNRAVASTSYAVPSTSRIAPCTSYDTLSNSHDAIVEQLFSTLRQSGKEKEEDKNKNEARQKAVKTIAVSSSLQRKRSKPALLDGRPALGVSSERTKTMTQKVLEKRSSKALKRGRLERGNKLRETFSVRGKRPRRQDRLRVRNSGANNNRKC